jgi:hypothetical protein
MGVLRRALPPSKTFDPIWESQAVAWLARCVVRRRHYQERMRRPQQRGFLRSLFEQAHEDVPSSSTLGMLADVAACAVYRQSAPTPAWARCAAQEVGEAYRLGAG